MEMVWRSRSERGDRVFRADDFGTGCHRLFHRLPVDTTWREQRILDGDVKQLPGVYNA